MNKKSKEWEQKSELQILEEVIRCVESRQKHSCKKKIKSIYKNIKRDQWLAKKFDHYMHLSKFNIRLLKDIFLFD